MKNKKYLIQILLVIAVVVLQAVAANAEPIISIDSEGITIGTPDNPQEFSSSVQILLLLTILSLAPSILIMMTSFTRIIIVLSTLRNALGTQQMPPNQVLIGLALFLTFFVMMPVTTDINENAIQPFSKGEISQQVAIDRSSDIIKGFMLKQISDEEDLAYFASLAGIRLPVEKETLPLRVVIPAFLINELTTAFKIGFIIYLPFLVIDMVVASTLMSMGMMMLPPVMISLPFKIMLFVLVDGWDLVIKSLVNTFAR